MKLTKEEIERLAECEDYFYKAVHADWSPYPGEARLTMMHGILTAHGWTETLRLGCQHCALRIVKALGAAYYESKRTLIDEMNDEQAAKETQMAAAKRRKVKVTAQEQ